MNKRNVITSESPRRLNVNKSSSMTPLPGNQKRMKKILVKKKDRFIAK